MGSEADINQPNKSSTDGRQLWGQLILTDRAALGTLGKDLQILTTRFPEQSTQLNCLLQKLVSKGFSEQFGTEFSEFARTITSTGFDSSAGQSALAAAIKIINLRGPEQADEIFSVIKNISWQQVPILVVFASEQERLVQYYSKDPDSEHADVIQNKLLERAISYSWVRQRLSQYLDVLLTENPTSQGNHVRVATISAIDKNNSKVCLKHLKAVSSFEANFLEFCNVKQQAVILGVDFLPLLVSSLQNLPKVGFSGVAEQKELCAIAAQIGSGTNVFKSWLQKNLENRSRCPSQLVSWIHRLAEYRAEGLSIEAAIVLESGDSTYQDPAGNICTILFEQYGSNEPMNRLVGALALFVDRAQQGNSLYEDILNRLVTDEVRYQFRAQSYSIEGILKDELRLEKLILCLEGRGLQPSESIHSQEQLLSLIVELEAQHDIYEVLGASGPDEFEVLNERFVERYSGDNPPFRLLPGPHGEPATPEEVQTTFMGQIIGTFMRHSDAHFGFWANTYNFKHTPVTQVCPADEMALRLQAQVSVIPSNDIKQFPGPGRVIENIDIRNIFFPERVDEVYDDYSDWRSYYLGAYGPIEGYNERGNIHPIDLMGKAKFTSFRAGMGIAVPQNRFINLDGESATLIDWNHHFDATGAQMATLVAGRVFDSFFESCLLPLDRVSPGLAREAAKRITDNPPTMRALIQRSKEMGVFAPVNLSAGSSFSGGLTNGVPIRERNYYHWENTNRDQDFLDRFRRSHKYHIKDDELMLRRHHMHHEQIYKCTAALQNVRDVFKLIVGLDARGDTRDFGTKEFNPYRMLEYFCLFTHEFSQVERIKQAPSLALAQANYWAREIESPFVFDGFTGYCFSAWDTPFEIKIRSDGTPSQQILDWWEERVIPYLNIDENSWVAPRLVDRQNSLGQMKMYGYSGE